MVTERKSKPNGNGAVNSSNHQSDTRVHLFCMVNRYLLSLLGPMIIGTIPMLGQTVDTVVVPPPPPPPVEEFGYWKSAEYMPLLRQCTASYTAYAEQQDCTTETIIKLVNENVRWPGPDVCVEGMAVISFIVEKDGTLTDFKIRRDPGQGTGQEALRAVKLMAEATVPWVPGKWGTALKPVRIHYNVPVKFRLD